MRKASISMIFPTIKDNKNANKLKIISLCTVCSFYLLASIFEALAKEDNVFYRIKTNIYCEACSSSEKIIYIVSVVSG